MLWASLERHIIIFAHTAFHIRWKRFVFHYIPLIIAIVYKPTFYLFAMFVYQCVNTWNYHELLCATPCFYRNKIFGTIEWLANTIMPAFTIALANLILIIRVVYRSTGIRRHPERTRKNRKMMVQLLATSSLFLIFWLPIAITGLIQEFFNPTFLQHIQFNVFLYLIYFINLLLPFVCLISLPEVKKVVMSRIREWKRRHAIFIVP